MFRWPGVRVKISTDETIYFQTLVQFSLPLILVEEVRKETSSFALFGIIEISNFIHIYRPLSAYSIDMESIGSLPNASTSCPWKVLLSLTA
jgi:hypothetical protein